MKIDIIFAGVGGQGIISAAAMVVQTATKLGLNAKQNEVHGMAQRGGSVVCFVRISDEEISSNTIPKGQADFIFATEPMEAIRYIDYISPNGTVITNDTPFINIPEYPDTDKLLGFLKNESNAIIIDGKRLNEEISNPKVANTAVLGVLIPRLGINKMEETFIELIELRFKSKGDKIIELNKKAYWWGKKITQ